MIIDYTKGIRACELFAAGKATKRALEYALSELEPADIETVAELLTMGETPAAALQFVGVEGAIGLPEGRASKAKPAKPASKAKPAKPAKPASKAKPAKPASKAKPAKPASHADTLKMAWADDSIADGETLALGDNCWIVYWDGKPWKVRGGKSRAYMNLAPVLALLADRQAMAELRKAAGIE